MARGAGACVAGAGTRHGPYGGQGRDLGVEVVDGRGGGLDEAMARGAGACEAGAGTRHGPYGGGGRDLVLEIANSFRVPKAFHVAA